MAEISSPILKTECITALAKPLRRARTSDDELSISTKRPHPAKTSLTPHRKRRRLRIFIIFCYRPFYCFRLPWAVSEPQPLNRKRSTGCAAYLQNTWSLITLMTGGQKQSFAFLQGCRNKSRLPTVEALRRLSGRPISQSATADKISPLQLPKTPHPDTRRPIRCPERRIAPRLSTTAPTATCPHIRLSLARDMMRASRL
jgi:hypothetical protein